MPFIKTEFKDLFLFDPLIHKDDRGYFFEGFNKATFKRETGVDVSFLQENQSYSYKKGVLRGLHFQNKPYAQAKLVSVLEGCVLDVVVDIRSTSPHYGKHFSVELSSENKRRLYIPHGFAHGFIVLSDGATFSYICDNYYSKEHEGGIRYNDPTLAIDWSLPEEDIHVSEKDNVLPFLQDCKHNF